MDYKKIIKSRQLRFRILNLFSWFPDSTMLKFQYRLKQGFWPDFDNPKRYTEKLQIYKMNYRNPVMFKCVDKYDVREYVEQKGLKNILNECYGLYDTPEDIEWSMLPDKFIIKTTTGGGGLNVILVKDKNTLDFEDIKKKLHLWIQKEKLKVSPGREWAYEGIGKDRIIIERLLEDDSNSDGSIDDYKLMCFDGKFKCLWIDKNRYSNHRRGFWDENLKFLYGVYSDHDTFDTPPALPSNMEEMVEIAEKLSADFPYARVDLYNIKGKITFGEITFYPWSGYVKYTPDSFDFTLGSFFNVDRFLREKLIIE